MNTVKIGFSDFWPGFDAKNNYFTELLRKRFDVMVSNQPDVLIYSVFGDEHRRHRGLRIFYTGENVRPDFAECDYAFTFDLDVAKPEHYRLPLCHRMRPQELVKPVDYDPEAILRSKDGFCAFVYSNPGGLERNRFFELLSRYKRVDAGGKLFNNIGGPVRDKQQFLTRYKFTFAFENDSYPGYTTEKIVDPMRANSLPIYWGNPRVDLDYNSRSFINYADWGSLEALAEHVAEVDRNDELYLAYLRQPWLHDNAVPATATDDSILAQFEKIFSDRRKPIAQTWVARLKSPFQRRRKWKGPQRLMP